MKKSTAALVDTTVVAEATGPKALANINGQYVYADTKLAWAITANPKRPSGRAYTRFEAYMKASTVQEYLDNGGTMSDLKYDQAKGFLTFAE